MALCAFAVFALHHQRAVTAGLASGFAIGLKLNNLPIVVFCLALMIFSRSNAKSLVKYLAGAFGGTILAYPLIFWAKPTEVGATTPDLYTTLLNMSSPRYEWDGIFSGGSLTFSVSVYPLAILILFGLWRSPRVAAAFLASVIFYLAMITVSRTQYGWYVFPLIPPALYLFSQAIRKSDIVSVVLSWVIIAMNVASQYSAIIFMVHQKNEQLAFLENPDATGCLMHHLNRMPPTARLFNVVEFGYKIPIPQSFGYANSGNASSADTILVMHRLMKSSFMQENLKGKKLIAACGDAMLFSSLEPVAE
ncbi:membrane hypothetical protein [Agrobacterium tumefaciens str. Kerr 14]|uniref:Uncharacterized protein n=2 Tax=Agrobacterium tumefaciens TaxID=358 RepID=A0A1S7RV53_AGRTU|nr:membrane hypothetical protein [Agrobacterium tumefaciens str. Kerr 14]